MAPCDARDFTCSHPAVADCDDCRESFCSLHVQFCEHCLVWFCQECFNQHTCKKPAEGERCLIDRMVGYGD
jgi:hypothetical protein